MLEKEDLRQIEEIVSTALESNNKILESKFETIFNEKLDPIRQELADIRFELQEIKQRLDMLERSESEDISVAYNDIETLKRQLSELEIKVQKLQASQS